MGNVTRKEECAMIKEENMIDKVAMDLAKIVPNFMARMRPLIQQTDELNGIMATRILSILSQKGSMPMKNLAYEARISKQQLTPVIKKLVQVGYVKRIKCETDKREVWIDSTQEGKNHCEQFHQKIADSIKSRIAGSKEQDIRELQTVIDNLYLLIDRLGV